VKCPAVDRRSEGRRRFDINDGATRVEGGRMRVQAVSSLGQMKVCMKDTLDALREREIAGWSR
jgi:hypothetical protein